MNFTGSWRNRLLLFLILISFFGVFPFLMLRNRLQSTVGRFLDGAFQHVDLRAFHKYNNNNNSTKTASKLISKEEEEEEEEFHGECLMLKWTDWGPWSKCSNTSDGGCVKGRFRSCICDPIKIRPPRICEASLGGKQNEFEECLITECLPPKPKKFIMEVPAYGPNNQYIGMKETMLIARDIQRTMILPNFLGHGDGTIRLFNTTFDYAPLTEYVDVTDIETYKRECGSKVEIMVWMRWESIHKGFVSYYLQQHGIDNIMAEDFVPLDLPREERAFRSHQEIKNFFAKYEDKKCLVIACPFRNIWFAEQERQQLGKYVYHADYIRELAKKAITEMGVTPDSMISFHWRYGEDSCAVHKVPNMTFCWGTSVFCWAKIEDVISVLISILNHTRDKFQHSVLYLSISIKFNPKDMYDKLRKGLAPHNIQIKSSPEVPTLAAIKDNYILSLVEQEICCLSKNFIASSWSTWSDYIVDWFFSSGRGDNVYEMNGLFQMHDKKYVQLILPELSRRRRK